MTSGRFKAGPVALLLGLPVVASAQLSRYIPEATAVAQANADRAIAGHRTYILAGSIVIAGQAIGAGLAFRVEPQEARDRMGSDSTD